MRCDCVRWFVGVLAVVALPAVGLAQDATLTGTVTDTTGGVLPGATITAVQEATGNSFVAVTDGNGVFQIPLRTGIYQVVAQLEGFSNATRAGLEVLVGQRIVVNLQLNLATLQEAVITVTGAAPLIETTSSSQNSNIDPRQLSELPINGRNWLDLTMLAAGSRVNTVNSDDLMPRASVGTSQLNVDGQQVTSTISATGFGQPHYARDSIAEFEFISNRFDATQGRSAGVQVNAVTKSGTNTFAGSAAGYFRHDSMNARDFIVNRVLPYENQQVSLTFGGPIVRNRIHFFGSYEYEREPSTQIYTTPYPGFNNDLTGNRTDPKTSVRVDMQFNVQTRLMARANTSRWFNQYDPRYTGGAVQTPSSSESTARPANQWFVSLTKILGTRAVNELKVGYNDFAFEAIPSARFPDNPGNASFPEEAYVGLGAPIILFSGFRIGQAHANAPQNNGQVQYSLRNDYTTRFTARGQHTTKIGAEWLHQWGPYFQCTNCMGTIDAGNRLPPADLEQLFPDIMDVSTWNLAALGVVRFYQVGISAVGFKQRTPKEIVGAWFQDDWQVTSRLTLNLGVRYDISKGQFAERRGVGPWVQAGRSIQKDRFGPRFGFAYALNDRTVIRGGSGKYFADVSDQVSSWTERYGTGEINAQVAYDGRANFAADPWNGRGQPTYEQALLIPGLRKSVSQIATPGLQVPYSYQSSVGFQRQLGSEMSVEADYVYNASRAELFQMNINLTYDPITGVLNPSTNAALAVYPDWGTVNAYHSKGWSNYHALQTAFTKRFNQRWQLAGTYTLSAFWDGIPSPAPHINLVEDLGRQYSLGVTDQRHRAVANGIWDVGRGLQLSGLYFFGSGQRFATTYGGGDRPRLRTAGPQAGTIVTRNNLVGDSIHRVDLRVMQRVPLRGRMAVDGLVELFNLFNRANYGSYTTAESNPNYGKPVQNVGLAYQPRMLQLGFRFMF